MLNVFKETWKVSLGALSHTRDLEIGDERGDIVCSVNIMHRRYSDELEDKQAAFDTANIIAASPELFRAAEDAIKGLESGKGSVPFIIAGLKSAVLKAKRRS